MRRQRLSRAVMGSSRSANVLLLVGRCEASIKEGPRSKLYTSVGLESPPSETQPQQHREFFLSCYKMIRRLTGNMTMIGQCSPTGSMSSQLRNDWAKQRYFEFYYVIDSSNKALSIEYYCKEVHLG